MIFGERMIGRVEYFLLIGLFNSNQRTGYQIINDSLPFPPKAWPNLRIKLDFALVEWTSLLLRRDLLHLKLLKSIQFLLPITFALKMNRLRFNRKS